MKILIRSMLAATALALTAMIASQAGVAQAPAGAPAGATGLCNDGSYWTGASKSGACRGHKGVKTWYASTGRRSAGNARSCGRCSRCGAGSKDQDCDYGRDRDRAGSRWWSRSGLVKHVYQGLSLPGD
jgi:hypothetical protein